MKRPFRVLLSTAFAGALAITGMTLVAGAGCQSGEPAARADEAQKTGVAQTNNRSEEQAMVRVYVFNEEGKLVGPVETPKVVKTDAEWKAILTPDQYRIARGKETERPFCGTLLDNEKQGVYSCVCCGLPLFSSASKFHSGTGWPSFFAPIADGNVAEKSDRSYGMERTEILCARCDGHLGHVFEDGPRPTGLRFCLNSESLTFTSEGDLKKLADPAAKKLASGGAPGGAAPGSSKSSGVAAGAVVAAAATGTPARETAVFAGGCFWCTEAVFDELDGVIGAVSGYAGGTKETANYETVSGGRTGHAESIEITYDPSKISYEQLLEVFFATHDPTTLNQQGNDMGTQYRSAIFYKNEQEKELAGAYIADLTDAKVFSKPIVTTLEPLTGFYPAETYHQNFVCLNPDQGYVRAVAMPKVKKVREKFGSMLKKESPLDRAAATR